MDWNDDMSAAPRDGTDIELEFDLGDLTDHFPRVVVCHWSDHFDKWIFEGRAARGYSSCYKPFRWRHKPQPPEGE